jgi:hypothetical protein
MPVGSRGPSRRVTSGPELLLWSGAEPAPAWWAEPHRSNPMWPEGSRCRTARRNRERRPVQAGPVPVPEFRWRIRVHAAPGGMAPLEVRTFRLRPGCSVQRMSPREHRWPRLRPEQQAPRGTSPPLDIRLLGFGRSVSDGMCPASRSGRPPRGGPLSRQRVLASMPAGPPGGAPPPARLRVPPSRPGSDLRVRWFTRLPRDVRVTPPRWFAAGRVTALRGRFA